MPEPEHAATIYGRAVRTALGNNATAYGFSISITAAYGLLSGPQSTVTAAETIGFALGAAFAFAVVGAAFMIVFSQGSLGENAQIATISGGVDVLSIGCAVGAAYLLARLPGEWVWPLTGASTVATYLIVGGLDVLVARAVARHSAFGRSQ